MGVPPVCVPSASTPTFPVPQVQPQPRPSDQREPAQAAVGPTWWAERTGAEKGLIVGGAALAGYVLVTLMTGGMKAKPGMAYRTNRNINKAALRHGLSPHVKP
jgi:hypothetical protein